MTETDICYIVVLVTLLYASYRDLKCRDIPVTIWIPSLLITVILNTIKNNYIFPNLLVPLLPSLIILVQVLRGQIGGADFLAILLIGLAFPKYNLLPISLLTTISSFVFLILFLLFRVIKNYFIYIVKRKYKIQCALHGLFYIFAFGYPEPSKYIRAIFNKSQDSILALEYDNKIICCINNDVSMQKIDSILYNRTVNANATIWKTREIAFIPFILLGYTVSILCEHNIIPAIIFKLYN